MARNDFSDFVSECDLDLNCGLKVGNGFNHCRLNYDELRQGDLNAIGSKLTAFIIYFQYFSNIAMSLFKYNCGNIPTEYIQRALFQDGRLAFFNGSVVNMTNDMQASTFTWGDTFNHYGDLTEIELFNTLPNTSDALSGIKLNLSDYEILYTNKTRTSLFLVVWYFCQKIMQQQITIDQNLVNNSLPVAVECTKEQILALNNIIKNVANQSRFLFFKKDKNARAEDLFKSLDLNIEFKADKMLDVVNYYKGEFYTMLGINNTPFEKRERLLRDEVKSNDQILQLTLDSMLSTQKECFKRINNKFGVNFSVELNTGFNDDFTIKETTINEGEVD